jgi:hypothetical protein
MADAAGMRVVAVAEHGDIDQVSRPYGILSDLTIDAREVDPLVEPTSGPLVAGVGNEVRQPPIYLYSPGFSRLPQITSIARFSP